MSTTLECRCRSEGIGVCELGWQALGMFPYIMHLMAGSERLPLV